jgi:hypothetical protein
MEYHLLLPGRDTLLMTIPFVVMLMVTIFRLDQIVASPTQVVAGRRFACSLDMYGKPILRDPDGRLSGPARQKKTAAGPAESVSAVNPGSGSRRKLPPEREFHRCPFAGVYSLDK